MTGVLAGTPEIAGHYEFTVKVQDSGLPPVGDEKSFKIRTEDGSTAPESGASTLHIWNCHTERRTVEIWTQDLTSATDWQKRESLPHQYNASGTCGDAAGASPFEIDLEDAHQYRIAVVDPDNELCTADPPHPTAGQCVRLETLVVGSDSGGVANITIS
jgi:hypothetical protein